MDVLSWNGALAGHLRAALRLSLEEFAQRVGVSPRTVSLWAEHHDTVPRPEIQRALDTLLRRAEPDERRRFGVLAQAPDGLGPQALRVAVAIVMRGGEVLLVQRRGDDRLDWQFPAGVVKPGARGGAVAVEETRNETGIRVMVLRSLGSRVHPVTGVVAEYFLCEHLAGQPDNRDPVENADVAYVPIGDLTRFIPRDAIYAPILHALEAA